MGNHRALLVANSRFYEDPEHLPELNAPIYDMARLQDALIHPTIGVFAREHVQLLPNARCADALLTIEGFFLDCTPEDTMLLYYSGHGKLDINNNFFLCAADTRLDRLVSTAIRDEQVNAMMRKSPARSFVLVLDCCSSGGWKSSSELLPDPLRGSGRFLITSSRAGQGSSDAAVATESSPFTRFLVEAMEEADVDVDADGFVDIDEIYRYVERNLRQSGQLAQRDFDKSAGSVALARRPKKTIAVTPEPTAPIGPLEPPSLTVVPEHIEVTGARSDELPVIERIYVFNRGGGVLDWEADSDDDWIALEPFDDFVRVSLTPRTIGSSRGTVYVRERNGAVERVPVQVQLVEGERRTVGTRLRTALIGSGWTRTRTAVVASVLAVVVVAVAIAAIDGPEPPVGDDGSPLTEMVFGWRQEDVVPPATSPGAGLVNGVARGGERFVGAGAVGSDAAIWVLSDGRWEGMARPEIGDQVINGVPWFAGSFVAVGASSTAGDRDAAAWRVSPTGALERIEAEAFDRPGDQVIHKATPFPGIGLVAVGQDDGDGAVWVSGSGDDWTLAADEDGELGGLGEQAMLRIARFTPVSGDAEMLIAVGYERNGVDVDGAVWIAEEPESWRRVRGSEDVFAGDGLQQITDVTGSPDGGVLAVGYAESEEGDLDAAVWSSEDGDDWSRFSSDVLGGPEDQKINRLIAPDPSLDLPTYIAAGSDDASGTMDAALWYFVGDDELKKQTSDGTPLGGDGDQEIFALVVQRPTGIIAVGYDGPPGQPIAAIWRGE